MAYFNAHPSSGIELANYKTETSITARSRDEAQNLNDSSTRTTDNDKRDMRRMGKKQEFRRNFRTLSTIGFTTCVMGTWEILLV